MNEEQAVLDFFAKEENLPLGLSVAEQIDKLREQMNNRLWRELHQHVDSLINTHQMDWQVEFTEDSNAPDNLVGLHCKARTEAEIYLRPMMEQQYLGSEWRIYFGLMWSAAPTPDLIGSAAVCNLKESLQHAGFKDNANFLAWQWTRFYPRRRDFLLRYAREPEKLLGEMTAILNTLLIDQRDSIKLANTELRSAPRSVTISLDRLRSKRGSD